MNSIILIALELEAPRMAKWNNVFFTGVGKVNAAMTAAKLIERHKPERVFNFGTAGGITVDSGLHRVDKFVQRDMSCAGLGYSPGQTPFEDGVVLGHVHDIEWNTGKTCSTGDDFVADPNLEIPADLVEMEAYAIAKVCQDAGVEFHCYKYVSDKADDDAAEEWSKTVAQGEPYFIRTYMTYK
jgi:adenosylhomocysteine nucleosidase